MAIGNATAHTTGTIATETNRPGLLTASVDRSLDALLKEATDSSFVEVAEFEEIVEPDTIRPAEFDHIISLTDTLQHYTSPYALPYSLTYSAGNWKRLWLNTSVLAGAYITTLGVLQTLPEDATAWNRAELQKRAPFNRWWRNVMVLGPEWDHDVFVFNYILHPYAGAVYYMSARSCGFNFYQSMLYSFLVSTVGWEFGVEAFMERPSYQDLFITPIVGSLIGEGFYKLKRHIVLHDYKLFGSPVIGNIVAFLVDPVNEVIGLFAGNDARSSSIRHYDEADPDYKPRRRPASTPDVSSNLWHNSSGTGISICCHF